MVHPRHAGALAGTALTATTALALLSGPHALGMPTSPTAARQAQSCVINVINRAQACAATSGEATALVTRGSGSAAVTLAIFYENINYSPSGDTEVLKIVGSPCTTTTSDIEYTISDLTYKKLRNTTWDNRISSVRTYAHCDVKFFDLTHGHGASTSFIDQNSDLRYYRDGWNDRASSLRLS